MAPRTYTQRTQMVEDKRGGCLGNSGRLIHFLAIAVILYLALW